MRDDLRYLLSTFEPRDRRLLGLSVIAQFIVATLDLLSVAVILPLMQVALGDDLRSGLLGDIYRLFGQPSRDTFVVQLAAVMISCFLLKAILAAALTWWQTGFLARLQVRTSNALLARFMAEDYLTHRRRNTAELMRVVGPAVQAAHIQVLGGVLSIVSSGMSIALIAILLVVAAPLPSLLAAVYFGVIVFVIQRVLGPRNIKAGTAAQDASWVSMNALVDSMHGFREAVLHDAEPHFLKRFDTGNRLAASAARRANFYSGLPKYLLELVTMIGLVLLIVVQVLAGDVQSTMPTLSLFIAATIKVLPLMVALTATIGMIRVGQEGLRLAVAALKAPVEQAAIDVTDTARPVTAPSAPDEVRTGPIQVRDISFRYPGAAHDTLTDIRLDVRFGTSFALCGPSGAGKTTLVDIILGLIPPTSGTVLFAGKPTYQAGRAWHDLIAYVPQDVYIADDTLAGNIAFGMDESDRDLARIAECVQQAQLGDLVEQLPEGLNTLVGERGSRLSGGQRQRLGIARALYRNPKVLILDEATSALDNETEHRITETIRNLHGRITTILVAHRLSTVKHVDSLAFLSNGRVEAVGTFGEVQSTSPEFARMVHLGKLD